MKALTRSAVVLAALAALCLSGPVFAQEDPGMENFVKMLRKDIKAVKKELIAEAGAVPADKADAFWKSYDSYQAEGKEIFDRQMKNLKSFGINFDGMTDDKAAELVKNSLQLRKDRHSLQLRKDRLSLLESYYKKWTKIVGPINAAKVVQCEAAVNALIDAELASEMPLIQSPAKK
jgi:hypothetical protein